MAVPKREQFANNAVDALNGAIDDVVTSLNVADASAFPTDGNFRILIDSEIMLVTAISTNTFTVVRAQEGTVAASHSDAALVTQLLTAGSLERLITDNAIYSGSGLLPFGMFDRDGNVVDSSDFTWDNQSQASVVDRGRGMFINATASGTGSHWNRGLWLPAPASTPWSAIALLHPLASTNGSFAQSGMFIRESSSGKWYTYSCLNAIEVETWNNSTSAGAELFNTSAWLTNRMKWMRIRDDGTNLNFDISPNGVDWINLTTHGRTAHMAGGPDQAGVFVNRGNSVAVQQYLDVLHFSFGG